MLNEALAWIVWIRNCCPHFAVENVKQAVRGNFAFSPFIDALFETGPREEDLEGLYERIVGEGLFGLFRTGHEQRSIARLPLLGRRMVRESNIRAIERNVVQISGMTSRAYNVTSDHVARRIEGSFLPQGGRGQRELVWPPESLQHHVQKQKKNWGCLVSQEEWLEEDKERSHELLGLRYRFYSELMSLNPSNSECLIYLPLVHSSLSSFSTRTSWAW